MDTTHFGRTPTELCDAILTAMSPLQRAAGAGAVQTIGRVRGDSVEDIKPALQAGVPAILLHYEGSRTVRQAANGQRETDELLLKLLCIAGQVSSIRQRQAGDDERDYEAASAKNVGVEQLQDWGRYFAARGLRGAGAKQVKTVRTSQAYRISAEHFIGAVYMTCEREVDIYDDAGSVYLLHLGICHDPTNGVSGAWFEGDNTTPISDWPPPGVDGGVATL